MIYAIIVKCRVQTDICIDDGEACDSNHEDVGYTIHEEQQLELSPWLESKQPRGNFLIVRVDFVFTMIVISEWFIFLNCSVFPGNDLAASREVNGDDDR